MDSELNQIKEQICQGHHFLLSGGAGSGKTYTLVQIIQQLIERYPQSLIACITYTNAAVREIEGRVNHHNLRVSTIHDFLWNCIGHFQQELRESIVALINEERLKVSGSIDLPIDESFLLKDGYPINIQYKEYLKLKSGIVSHDEVILIADYMFDRYPKLREIVKGSYPFILIDEYQDTNPLVIKILLETLEKDKTRHTCVGFFGDSMQAIYDDGIGDLSAYLHPNGNVYEVRKEQNRRSPQVVIDLANRIRLDTLRQRPSKDERAPNMSNGSVKTGRALFLYSQNDNRTVDDVRHWLSEHEEWLFDDPKATKELNLTHKLIAGKAGFGILMEIYSRDPILCYADKVDKFVHTEGVATDDKTFGDVISYLSTMYPAQEKSFSPSKSQKEFIIQHEAMYNRALSYSYDILVKTYASNDQLVDDKKQSEDEASKTGSRRSDLVKHLMKIERCIYLYQSGQVADFLNVTEKKIVSALDKNELRSAIDQLINVSDKTIEEVINLADELGIVHKDEALERYAERNPYIYDRVMEVPYSEVQHLYQYLEGMTPFSTQHKTKGTEFDNVLVILDNGKWNKYNFEKMFTASAADLHNDVVKRTRKIFYVCCTRTKENLAVYYHLPSNAVISKAKEWFGNDSVIEI